jgi:hypothetical protein
MSFSEKMSRKTRPSSALGRSRPSTCRYGMVGDVRAFGVDVTLLEKSSWFTSWRNVTCAYMYIQYTRCSGFLRGVYVVWRYVV